jgi:threonine synthase
MSPARYLCPACGATLVADRPLWRCSCGSHLNLAPGRGLVRGEINAGDASLWRYRAAMALSEAPKVSMGEGWTPLVTRSWVGPIHEDSSGNAGASIATYAAATGIRCRIFVPVTAPRGKLMQIAATGAAVEAIPGTRQAVTDAALAAADASFYASHNWQPFFIEGTKTLAFELWEQLDFAVPDNILVPTGYGSNILGLDRGFDELRRRGEITRIPRLFAVQAANCAAFAAAWDAGGGAYVPFVPSPTMADGIATVRPVRVAEVFAALRRSRGGVIAVLEDEIGPALKRLGRLGLYVEPTAATAGAALSRLLADGTIRPDETTVAVLTGHGLKASERIGEILG